MSCFCSVGNTTASDAEGGGAAILVDIAHCDTVRIAFLDALGEGATGREESSRSR
jgi:hypothetical protein